MKILAEIHRRPGINIQGKIVYRTAVRGVIVRGRDLLMIYSSNVGDYKFPGGGLVEGESHEEALSREIQEECGTFLTQVGDEIGAVIEFNIAMESAYDVFKMTSHYYLCEVRNEFGVQKLDRYEQDLGFRPVWIDIERAIHFNKALLGSERSPEWLQREIFILAYIRQNLLPTLGI